MIYIHTYYINSVKHVMVYDFILHAVKQQKVLGGTIKVCEVLREYK